jgi:hypothetical protein
MERISIGTFVIGEIASDLLSYNCTNRDVRSHKGKENPVKAHPVYDVHRVAEAL